MALEATFRNLTACLHKVNDVMNALHITMEEPEQDEAAVADDLADKSLELMGMVHDAQKAAETARRALGEPPNMDHARRSLVVCQERFHRIEQRFSAELTSYKTISELARVAGRSKQWAAWANSATQAIEDCRPPLEQASEALAACWQELAERLGMTNISMQATNVGQQITLSRSKDRDQDRDQDMEVEGVT
jgi:hypothetical protein